MGSPCNLVNSVGTDQILVLSGQILSSQSRVSDDFYDAKELLSLLHR